MALQIDAQRLKDQKAATISLVSRGAPGSEPLMVTGFLVDDISVSGSNEYANFFEDTAIGRRIQSVRDTIQTGGDLLTGKTWKFEDFGQTAFSYSHSERFSIQVGFLVVEIDNRDDSIATARSLLRTVYPERGEGLRVLPPLRYQRGIQTDLLDSPALETLGTIGIKISTWFETDPVFIVQGVALDFSRVTSDTGRPLWMSASVSLTSYRMNPVSEVLGWFSAVRGSRVLGRATAGDRDSGLDLSNLDLSGLSGPSVIDRG